MDYAPRAAGYTAFTKVIYMVEDNLGILEIEYDPLLDDSSMYVLVDEYTMYPNGDRYNGIKVYLYRPKSIKIHHHRKSLFERMFERFVYGKVPSI